MTVDSLVTNVLNGMMDSLDDEQFAKLKDVLYMNLHDVDIFDKCYDLVPSIQENDMKKLEYFVITMKIARLSDGTISQYVNAVKKLRNAVGKNFIDITSYDIEYYLAKCHTEQKWKDSTLRANMCDINAFYKFLCKKDLMTKNPMDKLEKIHVEKPIRNAFSIVEIEKLKLACGNEFARDIALIHFLYASGIRVGELIELKWIDLDFQHLSFVVHGKGNKEREVKFNEKAGFYLLRYMDERMTREDKTKEEILPQPLFVTKKRSRITHDYKKLTKSDVRYILKKIGKVAGVEEIYPHKFRRTFATEAINRGMPLEDLRLLMGHEQYDTTLGYAQIKSTKLEQSYRIYCEN